MPQLPRPGLRVGTDYFARCGLAARPGVNVPHGIVDDTGALLEESAAGAALLPSLRQFFEQTASLNLRVQSHWHPLVWPFWMLGRCVLLLIQQLVYPLRRAEVRTRVVALDPERAGAGRGVVRTYASGSAFQIFIYTVTQSSSGPHTEVFIPLPFANLRARLRLDRLSPDQVCWTSAHSAADQTTGVWFELGRWSFQAPLGESITLWDAASAQCPDKVRSVDAQAMLYGRHEQKLWGFVLVAHTYAFRSAPPLPQ